MFAYKGCTFSQYAAAILDSMDVDSSLNIIVMDHHIMDTYGYAESFNRFEYWAEKSNMYGEVYGFEGTPSLVFDGYLGNAGVSEMQTYANYYNIVKNINSPYRLTANLEPTSLANRRFSLNVTIEKLSEQFDDDQIVVLAALTEDVDYNWGVAGKINNLVRVMYPDCNGTEATFDENNLFDTNFSIEVDDEYDIRNCKIVVWVENHTQGRIMQSKRVKITDCIDTNFYITASSNDSIMGSVSGGGAYSAYTNVELTATANDGFIFVRWNDGNTDNPRFVTVERDSTFTATFGILNEITITDCNNYDLGGGYNFYETGTHYGFFTNAEDVDSVVRLDLTIEQPMETSIRVVATNENNRNVVTWNPVSNNTMLGYLVYRQDAYGQYEVVDTVAIDAECSWTDEVSNTAVRPYRYAVATYDSCGNVSAMSDSHRTIHLQISLGQGNSRNLLWTDYEGIEFSTYRVYRGTSIDDMEMIMEMSRENHTYTDFNTEHDYYYQIEIVQGRSLIVSKSNIVSSNPNAIEIEQMSAEIALFPNPATDILNITSSETISEIEIVNVMGQVVKRIEVNSDNAVCDVEDLKAGVYVVRIHGTVVSQRKFIKE